MFIIVNMNELININSVLLSGAKVYIFFELSVLNSKRFRRDSFQGFTISGKKFQSYYLSRKTLFLPHDEEDVMREGDFQLSSLP